MKRTVTFVIAVALVSTLAASPAMAGSKTIQLVQAPAGQPYQAWGMASIKSSNKGQTFAVCTDANLKDGSKIVIAVEVAKSFDPPVWVDVAKADLYLGTATVLIDSRNDVSPVFPVRQVRRVKVMYKGQTILEGSFVKFNG